MHVWHAREHEIRHASLQDASCLPSRQIQFIFPSHADVRRRDSRIRHFSSRKPVGLVTFPPKYRLGLIQLLMVAVV